MQKLLDLMKRSSSVEDQIKIAGLQFQAAVKSGNQVEQEEARLKIHTYIDESLDLQLDLEMLKEERLTQLKRKF